MQDVLYKAKLDSKCLFKYWDKYLTNLILLFLQETKTNKNLTVFK